MCPGSDFLNKEFRNQRVGEKGPTPLFEDQAVRLVLTKCWPPESAKETNIDFPLMVSHELLKTLATKGVVLNLATRYMGYFVFETMPGFLGVFRDEFVRIREEELSETGEQRTIFRLYYGSELVVIWSCAGFKNVACNLRGGLMLGIEGDRIEATGCRFFLSEPPEGTPSIDVGPRHDILINFGTDMSFINEMALKKEEELLGRKLMRLDFDLSGIDTEMVYLKVQKDRDSKPTGCPFIVSNGEFKTRKGMKFLYLEKLSDYMVDVVLGNQVMSLLGSAVTLQRDRVVFKSKRDNYTENTVVFMLKPLNLDLGIRASDRVIFHKYDPNLDLRA